MVGKIKQAVKQQSVRNVCAKYAYLGSQSSLATLMLLKEFPEAKSVALIGKGSGRILHTGVEITIGVKKFYRDGRGDLSFEDFCSLFPQAEFCYLENGEEILGKSFKKHHHTPVSSEMIEKVKNRFLKTHPELWQKQSQQHLVQ